MVMCPHSEVKVKRQSHIPGFGWQHFIARVSLPLNEMAEKTLKAVKMRLLIKLIYCMSCSQPFHPACAPV